MQLPSLTILLASPRGFCAGVDRAIQIVEIAIEKYGPPIYVRHEIVHNQYVVNSLKSKGAIFVEEINEIACDNEVVAIGETGLDYFRSNGDLAWQRERFRTHIQSAKELKKPLIIHSREAKLDVIKILKEEKAHEVGGVMHCFVDDLETAKAAIDLDFLISFSGIVTFKNAKPLQEVARQISLKNMLIETDSPYLAPTPHRGKTNQPAYVRYVAEFLAELKEESFKDVAQNTTKNYEDKFNKINNL